MHEFKVYPSNLRRHKEGTNNRTKFTYVHVNLIFKPSLESGKEGKQTNKHRESFICIVTFFLRKLYHKVKSAWPGTGQTKDNILYTRLNILIFLPILAGKYSSIILDLLWHFRLECIECITEHLVIASTGFFILLAFSTF